MRAHHTLVQHVYMYIVHTLHLCFLISRIGKGGFLLLSSIISFPISVCVNPCLMRGESNPTRSPTEAFIDLSLLLLLPEYIYCSEQCNACSSLVSADALSLSLLVLAVYVVVYWGVSRI